MNARQIKQLAKNTLSGLHSGEVYTDDNDNQVESFYLGSLINPSGKYYMPFACSNVNPCPRCKGTGESKKVSECKYCNGTGKRMIIELANIRNEQPMITVEFLVLEHDTPVLWGIPGDVESAYFTCNLCNGKGYTHNTCKYCEGLGSREAYEDSLFWECLDYYANKMGGWIESGEGDSCDSFFVHPVTIEEDTNE